MALYIGGIIAFLLLRPLQARAVASGVNPLRAAMDGSPGGPHCPHSGASDCAGDGCDCASELGDNVRPYCVHNAGGLSVHGDEPDAHCLTRPRAWSRGHYGVTHDSDFGVGWSLSGGDQPIIWKWLHPILPMSYAVNGFRQTLYGNFDGRLVEAIVVLLSS
ncbi:MAG: hypothetical protein U1U88_001409 [Lawsonella clevelandensis]